MIWLSICTVDYLSDGAPSSYFGGSIAKMAYRAGLDHSHIPCCRPEQKYHPERLQECLDAHPEASGHPCPKYIYEIPDRPVWANQDSFIGIKATFSKGTTYQVSFSYLNHTTFQSQAHEAKAETLMLMRPKLTRSRSSSCTHLFFCLSPYFPSPPCPHPVLPLNLSLLPIHLLFQVLHSFSLLALPSCPTLHLAPLLCTMPLSFLTFPI